jgi:NAD(P)H-flavin reductase
VCTTDSDGNYIKSNYFCRRASGTSGSNTLEVFSTKPLPSSALSYITTSSTSGGNNIAAVRAGPLLLDYVGEDTISSIILVASGLGVLPSVQLLQSIASTSTSRSITVDDIEMIWINSNNNEFILSNEVEEVENKLSEKLNVVRICDPDCTYISNTSSSSTSNIITALKEKLPRYKSGILVIITGPLYLAKNYIPLFEDLQYPSENIIYVPTE